MLLFPMKEHWVRQLTNVYVFNLYVRRFESLMGLLIFTFPNMFKNIFFCSNIVKLKNSKPMKVFDYNVLLFSLISTDFQYHLKTEHIIYIMAVGQCKCNISDIFKHHMVILLFVTS